MPARTPPKSDFKVTVREVAARAGVSLMTVSRATTKPDQVNAETLARVRAAMAELGYVPNLAAASLRAAQSRLVAAIVPTLTTHMFNTMVSALTDTLAAGGYQLLVGQSKYQSDREASLVRAVLGRRPDAILVTGSVQDKAIRTLLSNAGIPVVEVGDLVRKHIDMAVGVSHEKLGTSVCRYLADQGHKRLAIFSGDDPRAERRNQTFLREAERLGLPPVHIARAPSPIDHAAGRGLMSQLVQHGPRVDAIHCSSDLLAAGVLTECRERGIGVPKDVAVIGMGDVDIAEALYPPLTSVRVDGGRIGEIAASMLLDRLAGKPLASNKVDVGFEIIQRQSA